MYNSKSTSVSVAIFSELFWPEGGGAELATYIITKDILSNKFRVTIVSATKRPSHDILKNCRYLYWHNLSAKFKPIEWLKIFLSRSTLKKIVESSDIIYIPSHTLLPLAIVCKYINPKTKIILHLHDYQPLTYTSVILAKMKLSLHSDLIVEAMENDLVRAILSSIIRPLNKINLVALRFADKIICVSNRQYDILSYFASFIKHKCTVIYNPLPPLRCVRKRLCNIPTFLYVGGGSPIKGFNIFVRVMLLTLLKENAKFIVTYGRPMKLKQISLLNRISKRYPNRLIIKGRIPYEQLTRIYSITWALLFPSIYEEPLPYTIIEAMLTKTIPIAFKVGGIYEIIKGTPAENLLVEPGDIYGLHRKVEEMLALSKEELSSIGKRLREHILRKFDNTAIFNKVLQIFKYA